MYGYIAGQPMAIPIYTVLPYCVIGFGVIAQPLTVLIVVVQGVEVDGIYLVHHFTLNSCSRRS